jgi:hypothetical protein
VEVALTVLALGELEVGIDFTMAIKYFVISDNLSNFDKEFICGYLKSFVVAFLVRLAVDSFWQTSENET